MNTQHRAFSIRTLLCVCCLLALLAGCSGDEAAPETDASGEPIHVEMPAPQPARVFTAYELSRLFENSRTEAGELMDTVVQVTGKARFVEGGLSLDRETQYGYFVCRMSKYSKDYSKVQRGDTVVVVGTLTAEFAYIYLEDCYYLGTTDAAQPEQTPAQGQPGGEEVDSLFGGWEQVDFSETGDGKCVLRYRIRPGWNNESTIHQNYYIVQDFIQKEGGDQYQEIQYFGLMDMGGNRDEVVMSFKLDAALIREIYDGSRPAPLFGAYASELWVHENLRLDPVPQDGAEPTTPVLRSTPPPQPAAPATQTETDPAFGGEETPLPEV